MKTIEQAFDWLMNHKPDIGFIAFIFACAVWITMNIMNFDNRLKSVESQLPELRHHMNERFNEMDKKFDKIDNRFEKVDARFDKMDAELVDIKLTLKKIETYLGTTNQNYKPESK